MQHFYRLKGLLHISLFCYLLFFSFTTIGGNVPPSALLIIKYASGGECVNSNAIYETDTNCTNIFLQATGGTVTKISDAQFRVQWTAGGSQTLTAYGTFTDADGNTSIKNATPLARNIANGPQEQLVVTRVGETTPMANAPVCIGTKLKLTAPAGAYECVWTNLRYATAKSDDGKELTVAPLETTTYTLTYKSQNFPCTPQPITYTVSVQARAADPIVSGATRLGPGNIELKVVNADPNASYTWYNAAKQQVGQPDTEYTLFTVMADADYYVRANSCEWGNYVKVPVRILSVQILLTSNWQVPTGPVPLRLGAGTKLYAQPTGSGSYQWRRNGVDLPSATSQYYTATQPGQYTVAWTPTNSTSTALSQSVDLVEDLAEQTVSGQAVSYVREITVLKPGQATQDEVKHLAVTERSQQVTYFDGFGRPLQQRAVQASPAQTDIVQHFAYDIHGQSPKGFLPFAAATTEMPGRYAEASAAVGLFYLNTAKVAVDKQPYSTTTWEASPLARVASQNKPGAAWQQHPGTVSYEVNSTQDNVHQWNGLDGAAFYAAASLSKQVLVDEDERSTIIFRDQLGRTILQRKVLPTGSGNVNNDTYTVYYESGAVQYTVPPAAVAAMATTGQWNLTADDAFVDRWFYQYRYDEQGRLAERQFPGQAPVQLIYDAFDRPILVQDGNRREAGTWYFTKYDAQNRTVLEGLVQDDRSREDIVDEQKAFVTSQDFEERQGNNYTTTNTYPPVQDGANATLLSQSFYDEYLLDAANVPYAYKPAGLAAAEPVATAYTAGLATMTRKRIVLNENQYGGFLTTAVFYDKYGNVIQKQSNNRLNSAPGLTDVTTIVYREQGFVPQPLRSIKHQETGIYDPVTVRNRFAYDHTGRLRDVWQQHNYRGEWDAEILVSHYNYNLLGQLIEKNLHSRDNGASFLQSEDFRYTLHGQLSHINNSALTDDQYAGIGSTNDDTNDIFGLELVREKGNADGLGNTARFDGGISAVRWQAHNSAQNNQPERERSYRFSYDGLGRLTDAYFKARNSAQPWAGWILEQGAYDEKNILYDANGNITNIDRYAQAGAGTGVQQIDALYSSYTQAGSTSNRIEWTYDYAQDARGFRNGDNSACQYDANGSLTYDPNKRLTLTYNILNKVERQSTAGGSVTCDYDASGTLLRRTATKTTGTTQLDYVGEFVYETSGTTVGLAWLPTPEGRALALPAAPDQLTYEYHLRDHLGNLRVAFRAQPGKGVTGLSSETNLDERLYERDGDYPNFHNVSSTRADFPSADRPPVASGTKVASVTGDQPGPYTFVPVANGDRLKIRVYYSAPNGPQLPPPALDSAPTVKTLPKWAILPTLTAPQPAPTEKGANRLLPRFAPGVQLSVTGLLAHWLGKSPATNLLPSSALARPLPKLAYLAWTLYDNEERAIRSGTVPAPAPAQNDASWRKMEQVLAIDLSTVEARTGQLRVQLVNDGDLPVYFDSLTILHPKAELLVSQENHYYPFGMALGGVAVNTQAAEVASLARFNGGSQLENDLLDEDNAFYATDLRSYDPTIGRFWGVDPLADSFTSYSPYHFAYNDPVNFSDPTGAYVAHVSPSQVPYSEFGGGAPHGDARGGSLAMFDAVYAANRGLGTGMPGFSPGPSLEQQAARFIGGPNAFYRNGHFIVKGVTYTNVAGSSQWNTHLWEKDMSFNFTGAQVSANSCFNCGWHMLVGFEGELTGGAQAKVDLTHALGLDINLFSIVVADFKLTNLDIDGSSYSRNNYKVKQSAGISVVGSLSYQHSFDVQDGEDINHQHEIRAGLAFIGGTITFNDHGELVNLYLGLDPSLGAALGGGFDIKYKIGANYKTGK